MNGNPHTHEVKVRKLGTSAVVVSYGDQERILFERLGKVSARRIRRTAEDLIYWHDKASAEAPRKAQAWESFVASLQPAQTQDWPSRGRR